MSYFMLWFGLGNYFSSATFSWCIAVFVPTVGLHIKRCAIEIAFPSVHLSLSVCDVLKMCVGLHHDFQAVRLSKPAHTCRLRLLEIGCDAQHQVDPRWRRSNWCIFCCISRIPDIPMRGCRIYRDLQPDELACTDRRQSDGDQSMQTGYTSGPQTTFCMASTAVVSD